MYVLLLVGYLSAVMSGCVADRLILFPSTHPVDPRGAARLTLPGAGGRLLEVFTAPADSAPPGEPQAFLLVFNGNADRAERAVHYAASEAGGRAIEVWAMNYPGYGTSAGPASLDAIGPAALAAHDALQARAGDRPIYLSGASLGGAAALAVAARRPVAGLLLYSTPPLRQLVLGRHGWWNLWLLAGPVAMRLPRDLDSIANARAASAPAVFVVTEADTIVPARFQDMVADAYRGPKKVIRLADAEHNDPALGADAESLRAALDWMFEHGKGTRE